MRSPPTLPWTVALVALTGCPPTPGPTPPPSTDTAAVPSAGTTTEPPKDPLAGSVFTKEQVLEIYRAEHAAGLPGASDAAKAEKDRVLRLHKIVDQDGDPIAARTGAYERALEALAKDEATWAEFVETLPR